jgi:hypothetical protein
VKHEKTKQTTSPTYLINIYNTKKQSKKAGLGGKPCFILTFPYKLKSNITFRPKTSVSAFSLVKILSLYIVSTCVCVSTLRAGGCQTK